MFQAKTKNSILKQLVENGNKDFVIETSKIRKQHKATNVFSMHSENHAPRGWLQLALKNKVQNVRQWLNSWLYIYSYEHVFQIWNNLRISDNLHYWFFCYIDKYIYIEWKTLFVILAFSSLQVAYWNSKKGHKFHKRLRKYDLTLQDFEDDLKSGDQKIMLVNVFLWDRIVFKKR